MVDTRARNRPKTPAANNAYKSGGAAGRSTVSVRLHQILSVPWMVPAPWKSPAQPADFNRYHIKMAVPPLAFS